MTYIRLFAPVVAVSLLLSACGDDDDAAASEDLDATCALMSEISGPEDVTLERLDALLAVAPDSVRSAMQVVRDRVGTVGDAAYEEEEVGAAFETVGAFESSECV